MNLLFLGSELVEENSNTAESFIELIIELFTSISNKGNILRSIIQNQD